MPTDPQPSPRPWRKHGTYLVHDASGELVCTANAADRNLILRAVNSYDAMRAALNEAMLALETAARILPQYETINFRVLRCRDALALAEERT